MKTPANRVAKSRFNPPKGTYERKRRVVSTQPLLPLTNGKRKVRRFGNKDFARALDIMRGNRDWFTENRPTDTEARLKMEALCGSEMCPGTFRELREESGVKWVAVRSDKGKTHGPKRAESSAVSYSPDQRHMLTVMEAVGWLCHKLGEEIPGNLDNLIRAYRKLVDE